jgi:hypothetical protein
MLTKAIFQFNTLFLIWLLLDTSVESHEMSKKLESEYTFKPSIPIDKIDVNVDFIFGFFDHILTTLLNLSDFPPYRHPVSLESFYILPQYR